MLDNDFEDENNTFLLYDLQSEMLPTCMVRFRRPSHSLSPALGFVLERMSMTLLPRYDRLNPNVALNNMSY
jgi:hypothetical protein